MENAESFEKELTTLRELGSETFVLRGSTIIVEILPAEEIKTKSGIIMATSQDHTRGNSMQAHRVEVGRVLMCGEGYYNENLNHEYDQENEVAGPVGGYEPLEVKPGAVVLLPQYSIQLMSHFPGIQRPTGNKLAMIKMDQVLAYYPTQEAYQLAKTKLNG